MFRRWLILAMVLIGGRGALAAEPSDLPPIDPPNHWHVLTQDDASSDSKCIGNPVTPLCAVETSLACFIRHDDELCRVGTGSMELPGLSGGVRQPVHTIRYRIVSSLIVTENNRQKVAIDRMQPDIGDVALQLKDVDCYSGRCQEPVGPPRTYLVRRGATGWYAADWAAPRW